MTAPAPASSALLRASFRTDRLGCACHIRFTTTTRHEYDCRNHLPDTVPDFVFLPGQLTENPFASTHSLDTNPFDDPVSTASSKVDVARLEDLERRERDLERRETELSQRAEHIRKHGRNNWPPCTSPLL